MAHAAGWVILEQTTKSAGCLDSHAKRVLNVNFYLVACCLKQARLEHATAVGERQRVVEEEERGKMAALAEQMSNESAQREGDIQRRHEAAMAKLAVQREQQVVHCPLAPVSQMLVTTTAA